MDVIDVIKELVVRIQMQEKQIDLLNEKINQITQCVKLYEGFIKDDVK